MWLQPMLSQASRPAPPPRPPAELLRLSLAAEKDGLAEPFKGVTANGEIEPNLFGVRSTGVSTEPVRTRGGRVPGEPRPTASAAPPRFPWTADEWRRWMNQSFYVRQGVSFKDMSGAQREAAFALLRAGLSAKGLKLTRDIMRLNHTLGELNDNNFEEYGEWLYHLTVMGTPSATEPWGWQFDGHHADHQLLRARRSGGDDAVLHGLRAGHGPLGQVQGHDDPQRRAAARARLRERPRRRATSQGHPQLLEDGQRHPDRGVEGQRGARLRRPSRHRADRAAAAPAARPRRPVRGQHGRRPRAGPDGRSARSTSTGPGSRGSARRSLAACSTTASTAPSS